MAKAVDPLKFRTVMGHFPTGVSVVTTAVNGERHGMTANSITSVSLDPVMVLACLTRGSRTALAIGKAGRFAVNILGEDQEEISRRFAKPGMDHFEGLEVHEAAGVPLLPGCIAHLLCSVHDIVEAGDHDIVLGNVEECDATSNGASPLVFFQGGYRSLPGMGRLG
ncbi:MAG TPA: flavin reductase family protein [Gaiellaceae bacterium]|jgi:flavin reductase (DIM6/NTAB) family NADH-FMN oxidoreductase RutF|nr:flavin reductase family protein [Gaiellaceae bacterium]